MIQHTVVFKLKHAPDSNEEAEFLYKAKALGSLPNVIDLKVMREVGTKNEFSFGLSMYFESAQAYQEYNNHPDHIEFVNKVWIPEVEEFLEIDYVAME